MGPMVACLLWALGVGWCWGMDGPVSNAAAASSGADVLHGESGAAPGSGTGRSIHGHVAPDQQNMEDELLRSQMEWCERHPGGCSCSSCVRGMGMADGRSFEVGVIGLEYFVVAPSKTRAVNRCPHAARGWSLDQTCQAGIPMAFEQSEKMHNEAMRLLEERTGGFGRGSGSGGRGGFLQPLPNPMAMRAGYAAARAEEARTRGYAASWEPPPVWVAGRASPVGAGWNMVLSQCGHHIVYEPLWQTIWPPRNNLVAWQELSETWNEAVRAGVNPSPQFVLGAETLEALVARTESVELVPDGFARVRASYLAVEVEDDGTFAPLFVPWDFTAKSKRGLRVQGMPVQQRTWEAKVAMEKYVAAREALHVASAEVAASRGALAAAAADLPHLVQEGLPVARADAMVPEQGEGVRVARDPAARGTYEGGAGNGGEEDLPQGNRSRSRSRPQSIAVEPAQLGTDEALLANGARIFHESEAHGVAIVGPGALQAVDATGGISTTATGAEGVAHGHGDLGAGALLDAAAQGGSAAAASGSPGRGRSLSRSAADSAKRARVEQPLARPAEASAAASGDGEGHCAGGAHPHRNRHTGGLGLRSALSAFQLAWGFGGGQEAAEAPVGLAEEASVRADQTPACHVAEMEAAPSPHVGEASAGKTAGAEPSAPVAEGLAAPDEKSHWREGGWAKSDEPGEPEWWSGQWRHSPTRWGADAAEGQDRASGSGSAWAAAGHAGDAAGPTSATRGAGIPWAQAAAAVASASPGPMARKGNWGKSLLALLRHGGTKDKNSGIRPFAQHLVIRDVPDLPDAQWATLDSLGSAMRIIMVRKLLFFILFREEEGLLANDKVSRHYVLGELGADGLKVFLGALPSDQWHGTVEEAAWARLPHLVIRSGMDEAPRRVRISGNDFAGLAEHTAPLANSPWVPVLGSLAEDGRTHQLDWVHATTHERRFGQVPLM